jgi:hypothetical protein
MRRTLLVILGLLEIAFAAVLFYVVTLLPSGDEVRQPFGKVEAVARQASEGVAQLRHQVAGFRERQPLLREAAERLLVNTRPLTNAATQPLDFGMIEMIRDSLGDVARGLDAVKDYLKPETGKQIRASLKGTAEFLDTRVARGFDRLVPGIKDDAENLAKVLRQADEGLGNSVDSWPRVQANLSKAAEVLRHTQEQLNRAVVNKEQYQAAVKQSAELARTFIESLPVHAEQLEFDLAEQEASLSDLSDDLDHVRGSVGSVADGAVLVVVLVRWLLLLLGGIFLLHGIVSILGRGPSGS